MLMLLWRITLTLLNESQAELFLRYVVFKIERPRHVELASPQLITQVNQLREY